MVGHVAGQAIHDAQDPLALAFTVGLVPAMGHLDTQFIHPTQEDFRLLHPVLEPLVADQAHRLHQGARGVAQQDPVDRVVNVGLYAGGIQEIGFQVQRLVQVQHTGLGLALLEQLVDGLLDLG